MTLLTNTIVVPVFNEELYINRFYEEVKANIDQEHYQWQFLFVDDGSKDSTHKILQSRRQQDLRVGYLRFSRNCGHQNSSFNGLT